MIGGLCRKLAACPLPTLGRIENQPGHAQPLGNGDLPPYNQTHRGESSTISHHLPSSTSIKHDQPSWSHHFCCVMAYVISLTWPWFWWLPTILAVHWGRLQMSRCTLAQTTAFPGSFGMVMVEVSAVANLKLQNLGHVFSWSWDIKTYLKKTSLNTSNHQPHKLLFKECTKKLAPLWKRSRIGD